MSVERMTRRAVRSAAAVLLGLLWVATAPVQAGPAIEAWRTDNGARVLFVAAPELPMVDVRVVFDAGGARDGGRAGLAQLTNALLSQGAGGLSADQIAERFESIGARMGSGALKDMAWVSVRSLSEPARLQEAAALLRTVLTRPDFPARDFQRERERMLVAVRHRQQDPGEIGKKRFFELIYGDHPYALPSEGTEETLPALRRDDVVAFYRRYYVGANAVVAIVGDLDRAGAEALARELVGALPEGEPAPALPPVAALTAARTERIAHPSTQTHLYMGQPGMTRTDPDYFALYVGNHILGGSGLVSRLNEEIREKRGLSYSVYSYFMPMREAGPYLLGLQTRNEQADQALEIARATLERFVEEGPTAKELEASKKNITGGFALRIDSNREIVEYLAMIGFYDLPLDYLDTFTGRVEAVRLDEIRDAFRRRVHPDKMATVLVGGAGEAAGAAP